jgi:hypothetical protein
MFKRITMLMLMSVLLLLATAAQAFASEDEQNVLPAWAHYFSQDYDRVSQYHFALLLADITDTSGNFLRDVVPHMDGTAVTYAVEDTSAWPDPDALSDTTLDTAQQMWGGRISMEQKSINGAVVYIRYGEGAASYDSSVIADVTTKGINPANGVLGTSGDVAFTTTLTLYDSWFTYSAQARGKVLAHELGHVFGLADVYGIAGLDIQGALMGNAWLAAEQGIAGAVPLASAGTPDTNGTRVTARMANDMKERT